MKNTVGVILIGLASLIAAPQGTFEIEDAVLYDVQILNVTYLDGAIKHINNHGMIERGVIFKLHALLGEVQSGKHPNWRSKEIVEIAKTYVETTKTQNQVLTHLQAKMNSIENYISKEHSYAK